MTQARLLSLLALAACTSAAFCQNTPTIQPAPSVGFQLPRFSGQFNYALSASQTVITGYNGNQGGGTVSSTNVSGDLAYLSRSETHPFGIIYSGGFLGSESSQLPSSTYQNLALSQSYKTKSWNFVIDDTVSYLPESPVGGISGVAGVGDLGVSPVQVGIYSGPGILTNYDNRVSNIVGATVERNLTGSTSLTGTGSYAIQRFLNNSSASADFSDFDSNQVEASGGILHRLDARNTIGANYVYSRFTYTQQTFSFTSNGVNFEYIRRWNPRLTLDASVGPQWNDSSTFSSTSLNFSAAISLAYVGERSSASLSYTRGTNAGSGVVEGALSDNVGFTVSHRLNRVWSAAGTASYTHTESLPNLVFLPFSVNSEVVSGQLNRGIGRSFSVYGSYTLENQSVSGTASTALTFNGLQQVFGFGVTYSPSSFHVGRQ